jgi:hypothetical protein
MSPYVLPMSVLNLFGANAQFALPGAHVKRLGVPPCWTVGPVCFACSTLLLEVLPTLIQRRHSFTP